MKKTNILAALIVFLFSGYIGYTTNYTNTSKAEAVVTMPQPITIMPPQGFTLNLDLNKGTAVVSNTNRDVKINVERKDSIIYKTKYRKVFVDKPIAVRVTPPFAKVHETPVVLVDMANSH